MKLALLADVHLDAQFGQFPADVARRRRQAIRNTLSAALARAISDRAEAVLIAGDLYEHDRISVSPDTRNFLRGLFAELDPIPVFIAPGNHDWLGPLSLYRLVEWSPNVTVFPSSHLEAVELENGLTLWGAAHSAPAGTRGFLQGFSVDRGGTNIALFHGSERGGLPFQLLRCRRTPRWRDVVR